MNAYITPAPTAITTQRDDQKGAERTSESRPRHDVLTFSSVSSAARAAVGFRRGSRASDPRRPCVSFDAPLSVVRPAIGSGFGRGRRVDALKLRQETRRRPRHVRHVNHPSAHCP